MKQRERITRLEKEVSLLNEMVEEIQVLVKGELFGMEIKKMREQLDGGCGTNE